MTLPTTSDATTTNALAMAFTVLRGAPAASGVPAKRAIRARSSILNGPAFGDDNTPAA
jgi:hypothetical protein